MKNFIKIKEYRKKYKNATITMLFDVRIYTNDEQFIVSFSSSSTGIHFGDNECICSNISVSDNYEQALDMFDIDKSFINSYLACDSWDDVQEEELDGENCD